MSRQSGFTGFKPVIKILLLLILFTAMVRGQTYLDSTAAIGARVEDLLSRMSLAEKIGQMTQAERSALESDDDISTYFLGSLLSGGGSAPGNNSPEGWADMYDHFQSKALATPLAIPLIYGIDAVHGHNNVKGAVIFPHNIGLGATGNPQLVRQAAQITALEVAGTGIDWTFAPCIAVPRHIGWGRTYEGFGETPELQVMMTGAAVLGFQGDSLTGGGSILACAKHYVGDGGTTDGIDQGNTEVDEETLRAVHLPGYIGAIDAGVGSVMASFSSWNGQKLHGHKYLLTDVLKDELGFKGFVVSDWAGIDQLPGDYTSDVEQSINAGIDMVMTPYNYKEFISTLTALVNSGNVTMDRIDDAVRRILHQKFRLGLFEHPYTDRALTAQIGSAGHRETGRQAVRESMVLLAQRDGILPLKKDGQKILVAGQHGDDIGLQCGGWSISWQGESGSITEGTTILQAIENAVNTSEVIYSENATLATDADIALVVAGERPYAEGGGDSQELFLNDDQSLMIKNLKNAGMKVALVLISGRPLILENIMPYTDAVFAAWLPGTEGQGAADILFGDYQPTGRLGHSWPRAMEQEPINYGDADYDPLFEYGHGIEFTGDHPAGTAPEYYSGRVTDDAAALFLSFTRAVEISGVSVSDFSVKVNSATVAVDSVETAVNDTGAIILGLQSKLQPGDQASVAYSGTALRSTDGTPVNAFGPFAVYNPLTTGALYTAIPATIQAEDYYDMAGIQTEICSDTGGGLNVGWIDAGDWLAYRIEVPETDSYIMKYRIASLSAGGKATALVNNDTVATTSFPVTGGWQNWTTVEQEVNLQAGQSILKIVCDIGGFNINWIAFGDNTTGIINAPVVPSRTVLLRNYPNPFNPLTTIRFELAEPARATLVLYDLQGRLVKKLADKHYTAGRHAVMLDGHNLPSGVYFCTLSAGDYTSTRKLMLIR